MDDLNNNDFYNDGSYSALSLPRPSMRLDSDSTITSETIMAVQQFSPVLIKCVVYGSDYDISLDEEDHETHEEIGKALVKVSSSIKYFILNGQSLRSSPGTIEVW
nr:5507_t:CDS:2 [Entrophospora candida]